MKIKLSKILKFFFITILNIFIIFVVQFYFNMNASLDKYNSDLKVALFINGDTDKTKEDIIAKLTDYNRFNVAEFVDADSFEAFANSSPELAEFVPKENFVMPAFVLANNVKVKDFSELERLQKEFIDIDFIDDVVFDVSAYKLFFKYKNLLETYRDFCTMLFLVLTVILILKVLMFAVKGWLGDVFFEAGLGILASLLAYAVMCVALVAYPDNNIFALDYHILYIVIPLSIMINLITKESNVQN